MHLKVILLVTLMGVGPIFGQTLADTKANMACIERLELPNYPAVAEQARIQAVATTSVALAEGGSVQRVSSEIQLNASNKVFADPIEQAMKRSTFRSECSGRTVVLVFHFRLRDKLPDSSQQRFAFGYPNQFWITVGPQLVQPSTAKSTGSN